MTATVLIVDDDAQFRALAARMLTAEGLTVVGEAADVSQGLAAAQALRPDAALVDVRLPDGDGIALAGELARLPWSPRVVVVSTETGVATPTARPERDATAVRRQGGPRERAPARAALRRVVSTG